MAENYNLLDLDVSWNNILPNSMNEIMEELEVNRNIRYLNLSWNQIRGLNTVMNKEIVGRLSKFINENR